MVQTGQQNNLTYQQHMLDVTGDLIGQLASATGAGAASQASISAASASASTAQAAAGAQMSKYFLIGAGVLAAVLLFKK